MRERAFFCGYAYSDDPNAGHSDAELAARMAEIAAQQVRDTGAGLFEYKIGLHSIDCEIGIFHAVRAAVGDRIKIGVDANMGLSMDEACAFLGGVKSAGLANIEEPVARLVEMEILRARFDIPVSTRCCDADTLARYPKIDALVVDPQLVGGISGFLEKVALAECLGKRIWLRALGARHRLGRFLPPRPGLPATRPAQPGVDRLDRGRSGAGQALAGPRRRCASTRCAGAGRGDRQGGAGALRGPLLTVCISQSLIP